MSRFVSCPKLDFTPLPLPAPPKTQALASATFRPPPLDGSLTLPELYDWHYHNTPDHPVFVYPGEDGQPRTVKWPEASCAFNRGARLIRGLTGLQSSPGTDAVVGIFAASDTITYFTLIASTVRAGLVPFLISPRNSPAAVAHLLSATQTNHVLVGPEPSLQDGFQAALRMLQQANPQIVLPTYSNVPSFDDLYGFEQPFVSLPPYKPELGSLGMILHSSGSTAFPKPIGWSHLQLLQLGFVPYFGDRDLTGVKLSCHAMPMFHGMGMMQTVWTASMGITITAARPQSPPIPPTPDNVLASAKATNSDVLFCVPSFVEAWSRNEDTVRYLSTIDGILFGGGPLNKKVGDMMTRRGVTVFILYGCSEIGIMSPILPRETDLDWEYFTPAKQIKTAFIPNGFGQYELVVLPNPYEIPCVINGKLDGQDAYYTSDLLVAHPTKPGYYKVFGRADDQIMHNTGEKTNPGPLENILNQDPLVQSSVMFGRGKFNVGVLVDPKPGYRFDLSSPAKLGEFRNAIWPTVERMNQYAPQHSRLFKEMILVAIPSKPFDYTAKSTARRQTILANYSDEIEALYESVAETTQAEVEPPSCWNAEQTGQFVKKVVLKVMKVDILEDDDDFFQRGCDSLQATWIRNTLLRAIRDGAKASTNTVPENLVYQYPTIAKLSAFVVRLASRGASAANFSEFDQLIAQNMEDMVERYSTDFPARSAVNGVAPVTEGGDVFLITGTTGSLGVSLLADILKSPRTAKVFAVNRPGHGAMSLLDRQVKALQSIGLDSESLITSSRLVLVEADVTDTGAGLTSVLAEEVRSSVSHIIINAWPVDFNLSLQSFEPSVKAVRNLIDLALASSRPTPPKITFVSSIGVLSRHRGSPALELPAPSSEAEATGYSQSKWVAESILLKAVQTTSLSVAIVRVGQVSGGMNGFWKKLDWLPTVVKSSKALGCFPGFEDDKVVSWVPLQSASQILLELATSQGGQVFHLVNPNPVSAGRVSKTISSKLGVPLVSYSNWLAQLEERAKGTVGADDLHVIPALRMLPFFRFVGAGVSDGTKEAWGLPSLDTARMCKSSVLASNMTRVDEGEIASWVQSWHDTGFL